MIKSMTGYGRAQSNVDGWSISVEIKSVNHRYFEFSSKVPRTYGFLDEKLKSYISTKVARGKIECYVYIEALQNDECTVAINHSLASGLMKAYAELAETYDLRNDVTVSSLSRTPDLFSITHADANEDEVWERVKAVLDVAIANFVAMREKEGEKLKNDILSRLDTIISEVEFIESRSPQTVAEYREKLFTKMQAVLQDAAVDEARILTEAAIYADKIAVDEETVRLRSHVAQMREFMEGDIAIGRKADFLIQEFNREANTIGSKCQDVAISKKVINIKAEIEKIREQIQNIE